MRGRVWGKEKEALLSTLPPPFPFGLQSQTPGSPQSGSPQEPPRSCHMLACVYVCVSVVSKAAWKGAMASIRLGRFWAVPLLSVQGL